MSGWIKLRRSLKDWEWYQDANATRLLIHFLVSVNYEPKKWKGIHIESGEMVTSYDNLGKDLNLSKQQVRTALSKLEKSGEITRKRTRDCLHVSLVKWGKIQNDQPEDNTQSNPRTTREQPENNPSVTPTKEGKKERTEESKKEVNNTSLSPKVSKFNFKNSLIELGFQKNLVEDWLKVRSKKKASNTKTAFDGFIREIEKSNRDKNEILQIIVERDWKGFKNEWLNNLTPKTNGSTGTKYESAAERDKRISEARELESNYELLRQMHPDAKESDLPRLLQQYRDDPSYHQSNS